MDHLEFAVSLHTAKALVERCIAARQPVMIWGSPGLGKSDIIAQIAEETGRPVIDMRLLIMEPTDIKGIPFYCPETNTMRWARPGELPGEDEVELHNAILFLDELTAAPQSVQAAAYQLVLNRRVGTYELPKGVDMVAAGNLVTDRAVSNHMPSALKNRFVHFTVKANFEDWEDWAVKNRIHPDVIGYLKANPGNLFNFDPRSQDNAFATPRSWAFVSKLYDPELPESVNRNLVGGTVGQGLAIEFMSHVRLKGKLPTPEEVLTGEVEKLTREQRDIGPSALYALTVGLCYAMSERLSALNAEGKNPEKDKNWNATSDRFLSFMMKNMNPEMVIMGAVIALRTYKLPLNSEGDVFEEFFQKYRKYLKLG